MLTAITEYPGSTPLDTKCQPPDAHTKLNKITGLKTFLPLDSDSGSENHLRSKCFLAVLEMEGEMKAFKRLIYQITDL